MTAQSKISILQRRIAGLQETGQKFQAAGRDVTALLNALHAARRELAALQGK